MSRLGADGRRIAIVGAPSNEGVRIRDALVEHGVRGSCVNLYSSTAGELLIGEYDGEARMIQDPDAAEIAGHDVVFLCDLGPLGREIASFAGAASLIVDIAGGLGESSSDSGARVVSVAHALSFALSEILGPLEAESGLLEATAFIVRPASDFGQEGLDELRDQTVRLLNFASVPTGIFGRQLAFNLIPQAELSVEPPDLEARVAAEVAATLGLARSCVAVRMIAAPLFYGHGIQLRFRLRTDETAERVADILRSGGLQLGRHAGDSPATPLEVVGDDRISLSSLGGDGIGGFWVWGVVGNLDARGAREAVRIVDRELGIVAQ